MQRTKNKISYSLDFFTRQTWQPFPVNTPHLKQFLVKIINESDKFVC